MTSRRAPSRRVCCGPGRPPRARPARIRERRIRPAPHSDVSARLRPTLKRRLRRAGAYAGRACGLLWLIGCGLPWPDVGVPDAPDVARSIERASGAAPDRALPAARPIFTQIPGKAHSHAPTIVAFDDGELLAAWYSYDGSNELVGSSIWMARRAAGQSRWSEPWLHIDRPIGDGNPVLYAEGDRVWLFQAVVPAGWATAHIEFQVSTDRGRTWSAPRVLTDRLGANVRFAPLRTASGELLLPVYDDLLGGALFYASDDGLRWRLRGGVSTGLVGFNLQPALVQLADGRLIAFMRNRRRGSLLVSVSGDAGRRWTRPAVTVLPNPDAPAAVLRLADGRLVMVFNPSATRRRPLALSVSRDGGVTWTSPRVLVDAPGEHSYPALVQAADGRVHIVYSHDRAWIGHIELDPAALDDPPQANPSAAQPRATRR